MDLRNRPHQAPCVAISHAESLDQCGRVRRLDGSSGATASVPRELMKTMHRQATMKLRDQPTKKLCEITNTEAKLSLDCSQSYRVYESSACQFLDPFFELLHLYTLILAARSYLLSSCATHFAYLTTSASVLSYLLVDVQARLHVSCPL